MKTVQWNIGGGKVLNEATGAYDADGLDEITSFLAEQNPDIITLEETHADDTRVQAELIAKALGMEFWRNDAYAKSHIEEGQKLGQAIISRYPIKSHDFRLFTNPNFEAVWDDEKVLSHDKGVTTCVVEHPRAGDIQVQALHMVPFRPFGVDPHSEEGGPVLEDVARKILASQCAVRLLQGDFNIDATSLRSSFPELFDGIFREVEQVDRTTPRDRRYDHILFSGMILQGSRVFEDVRTDHFPILTNLSF